MGSELVCVDSEEIAKQTADQVKLSFAMRIIINGGAHSKLKHDLDAYADSRNGDANYYRISFSQAVTLLTKAKKALWRQNRESPRQTFAKHSARLEALYEEAKADGNKSLALAVEDRLLALHGCDKESLLMKAGERSRQLGQRLDAALGRLSAAIGSLINEHTPTGEATALEDGSDPQPTALEDDEL